MTRTILAALLVLLSAKGAFSQSEERKSVAHIGFVYPLSTNGVVAPQISNSFSFHAIAGLSAAETGFALSGITNVVIGDANGFQLAGISNHVGGNSSGAMISGIANTVKGDADGLQLAGIVNTARNVNGMQLAGIANIAGGNAAKMQLSGFINVAADVDGMQLAGFMNKAKNVRGVQMAGFINIADSSDYPIGLVNIVRNGHKAVGATIDESGTALVSLRSGGRALYGIIGAGANIQYRDRELWALEAGMGAHINILPWLRINAEATVLSLTDHWNESYLRSGFRLLPTVSIAKRIELFAGPSFNQVYSSNSIGNSLGEDYLWSRRRSGYFTGLFFGAIGGLQVRF